MKETLLRSCRPALFALLALLLIGCGEGVPKTADAAVLKVTKGLSEGKPVVAWEALPGSYQKDVQDLVHTAVGKIEPGLWNDSFKVGQRVGKILREKKQFIMGHPMIQAGLAEGAKSGVDKATIEKMYDPLVGAIEAIVNSEIADYEKARAVDVGAFIDRTGSKVWAAVEELVKLMPAGGEGPGRKNEVASMVEHMKQIKATLVKEEGDTATVKIEMPGPDGKPEVKEEQFVRVEGKWIPKEMKDDWAKMIADAKKGLAERSDEDIKQQAENAKSFLKEADKILAPLENAKTQDEFNAALEEIAKIIQALSGGGGF